MSSQSPVPPPPPPFVLMLLLLQYLLFLSLTPLTQVTTVSHSQVVTIPAPVISSSLFLLSSSGVQGKWPTPGGDLTSVPLLSSPDLDALCDPATPSPTASLPRSSPPRSSSIPSAALSSTPPHPPHPQLNFPPSVRAQTSAGRPGRAASGPGMIVFSVIFIICPKVDCFTSLLSSQVQRSLSLRSLRKAT